MKKRKRKLRKVVFMSPEVWESYCALAEEVGLSTSALVDLTLRKALETGVIGQMVKGVGKGDKKEVKEEKFRIKL